jgi:hypothetical protein
MSGAFRRVTINCSAPRHSAVARDGLEKPFDVASD